MLTKSPLVFAFCPLLVFALTTMAAVVLEERNFIDDFTSAVGSVATGTSGGLEHLGSALTAVAAHEFTVLTADGGQAPSLAVSVEEIATSIAGTLHTTTTADVGKAINGALGLWAVSIPGPLLGGFLTAVVSMTLGAFMII